MGGCARARPPTCVQVAFEAAALDFFVATVELCRTLRPKAKWGLYGYPDATFLPCTGTKCGYDDPKAGQCAAPTRKRDSTFSLFATAVLSSSPQGV